MKKIGFWLLISSIVVMNTTASGQIVDSFSDGDFTNNPTWGGDTGSWTIVENSTSGPNTTGSNTLRLNAPNDGSTSQFLSLQRTDSWDRTIVGSLGG